MLTKKAAFPYELLTSLESFERMTYFPPIAEFKSVLSGAIDESDYNHGKEVYEEFACQNMKEYMELYNKVDVLLLSEVIAEFRKYGLKEWKLDMVQFISLPQFSLECMLKSSSVEVELLNDIDMLLFIEQGIRGGLSYAGTRIAESVKGEWSIIDIDANNLVSNLTFIFVACVLMIKCSSTVMLSKSQCQCPDIDGLPNLHWPGLTGLHRICIRILDILLRYVM
jgi:hypothetical protein